MSGWVEQLPDSLHQDLTRDGLPDDAASEIVGIAEIYGMRRNDKVDEPTRSEIRKELERLENMTLQLRQRLMSGPPEAVQAIISEAYRSGVPGAVDELRSNLVTFDRLVAAAWQRMEPAEGRPSSLRTWLTIEIANVVERHGCQPTPRKNGHLCKALRRVLTSLGEPTLHFDRIARTALQQRDKNLATSLEV